MPYLRLILVLLSIVTCQLSNALPSFAQDSGTLQVGPAFVDLSLEEPLQEKSFQITYKNKSNKEINLELFPIDFKIVDPSGTIGFIGEEAGSYSYSLTSFLSFETDNLQLAPGETKNLNIVVKNRSDLSPGGHYAAIVARQSSETTSHNETNEFTKVSPAISTLVYFRKVGGERFNLSLKDSNWPRLPVVFSYPSTISLTFQNDGNVHLVPFGTIIIKDFLGRKIESGYINDSSTRVMPESRRYIAGYLTESNFSLPISFNTIEIKGKDSLGKTNFVYRNSFLYVNPLVIFLPVVLFILWKLGKMRRVKSKNKK